MLPKGIIAIPCTPYHGDMSLDFDSLINEVKFVLSSGANGIAYPIMASEFYVLSDQERKKAIETVIKTVDGSIPVCVGITGQNIHHSFELADHAQQAGANSLISMTPVLHSWHEDDVKNYFRLLDEKISIPLMLQNVNAYGMMPISISKVVDIVKHSKNIKYLKEEGTPSILRLEQAIREGKSHLKGVYGGFAGLQFLDEMKLGAFGSLMACEFVDVFSKIYDAWTSEDIDKAEKIFCRLLPALVYETKLFPAFPLSVLQKRGIIKHNKPRSVSMDLPKNILSQIDSYINDLGDLFISPP